jgi:hypothetical protein
LCGQAFFEEGHGASYDLSAAFYFVMNSKSALAILTYVPDCLKTDPPKPKPQPCRDVEKCLAAEKVWISHSGDKWQYQKFRAWGPNELANIITLAPLGYVYLKDPKENS